MRTVLTATDGMVYTDGVHVGKIVYLAQGQTADGWYEIPLDDCEPAAEEDYLAALEEFGVKV